LDTLDWLFLGLGNPEDKYFNTRHNVGWLVIDKLAALWGIKLNNYNTALACYPSRISATEKNVANLPRIVIAKPLTYVNDSGLAAKILIDKYNITANQMVVIYDDFALPLGQIRIRPKGSSGGHNGLNSIIETLGNTDFVRIRLGIGPVPEGRVTKDFVLSRFEKEELPKVEEMVNCATEAVKLVLFSGLDKAMNAYNKKVEPESL